MPNCSGNRKKLSDVILEKEESGLGDHSESREDIEVCAQINQSKKLLSTGHFCVTGELKVFTI